MSKINLKFSPYTFARVAVMKSNLLNNDDYHRLLKMGYNEILRFIAESSYRKEMDEYDVSSKDIAIVESALNANLIRTLQKLHRISNEGMKQVISVYLLRYDIENVKMILRSKFSKISEKEVEPLLYKSVNYSDDFFSNLNKKERVAEIINTFSSLRKMNLPTDSLFELENQLDQYYYQKVHNFSQNLNGKGKTIASFIKQELENINLKTILKLKNQNHTEIKKYLIQPSKFTQSLLDKSVDEIITMLKNKHYLSENSNKEDLELDLELSHLRKVSSLMHKNLLNVNYLLGFFFAKEIEVRNLKALIKGMKFGIEKSYLEKILII